MGATGLALRRLAASLLVLLLVSAVVYWGTAVLPGDALTAVLPMDVLQTISPEELARKRAELGIDRPHLVQFAEFLGRIAQLDFGRTTVTREAVLERIDHPLRNSLILAGLTAIAAPLAAIALAVASVLRPRGRLDATLTGGTLFAYSLPEFVTGNLLIILFAVLLPVAPAVIMLPTTAPSLDILGVIALPIATLILGGIAYQYRLLRAALIEALDSDYCERARLRLLAHLRRHRHRVHLRLPRHRPGAGAGHLHARHPQRAGHRAVRRQRRGAVQLRRRPDDPGPGPTRASAQPCLTQQPPPSLSLRHTAPAACCAPCAALPPASPPWPWCCTC